MTPQEEETKLLKDINLQIEALTNMLKNSPTAPFTDAVSLMNLTAVQVMVAEAIALKMKTAADNERISLNPVLKEQSAQLISDLGKVHDKMKNVHAECERLTEQFNTFAEACLGTKVFVLQMRPTKSKKEDHFLVEYK